MTNKPSKKQIWLEEAMAQYESPLLRYVERILNNLERSREVVQESFLKLWKEDQKKISPILAQWLYTVCRNRAFDISKKERRMSNISAQDQERIESQDESAPEKISREQNQSIVMRNLMELSESEREVILLKFQGELSYKQISEVTGHSVSYVGVLIHQSVMKLRTQISDSNNKGGRHDVR